MDIRQLVKRLLPGFAPLLAYIAVEAFCGETAGLMAGIALGMTEFLVVLLRDRKADAFIALDTALLAAMGAVSLALSDPVFYKLKPAIVELVFAVPLGASAFGSGAWLSAQVKRASGNLVLPGEALPTMKRSAFAMAAILVVHAAITAWAAVAASEAVWGFVSGAFLIILVVPVVMAPVIKARLAIRVRYRLEPGMPIDSGTSRRSLPGRRSRREELLPLVTREGAVVGKIRRSLAHGDPSGKGWPHPVIRLYGMDSADRLVLQRRAEDRAVAPGKWDALAAGHIAYGESIAESLIREAREEVDLDASGARFLRSYLWETGRERELAYVFLLRTDGPWKPDGIEVAEARALDPGELSTIVADGRSAEMFLFEYRAFLKDALARMASGDALPYHP